MKREQFAFLVGGLVFGILIGFGSYHAIHTTPSLDSTQTTQTGAPEPRGPRAPTQTGGPGGNAGAPMVARINEMKRILQDRPDDDAVLLALGNAYYDAAMWDQAVGYYERVVELKPGPDVLTDLGVCYRGLRDFDKALETFARANEMEPRHWQSLYNTVIVAVMDVGRVDVARQALDAMQAIEPRPAELDQGRIDQLGELIERAADAGNEPS
jgi:tetratricopeptide (TPR) repeat protein